MGYRQIHRDSVHDPDRFWAEAARAIAWDRAPTVILDADTAAPAARWFGDGTLNTCYNAVDRHVAFGRGGEPALIYDSPMTGAVETLTYAELLEAVRTAAGMLSALGVGHGDRVVIYMPMIPQAVVAMLACARLGAIHSVVFAGFAPRELAIRIDDAKPKVVLVASAGLEPKRQIPLAELLDRALDLAEHMPAHCVLLQRPQVPGAMRHPSLDWDEQIDGAEPVDCVPVAATDPLYILYTSGTTGGPKGVVRDNGGHAVALSWTMRTIYDVGAGDVFWAASDLGWVVGHSYIVYGPLLAGCTTVLYEGKPVGTPDAGAFWRVIEQHRVRTLFTAPTSLRAIRSADPHAELVSGRDLSGFAHLLLAGERLDSDTHAWADAHLPADVNDHWWQTETGWAITANPLGVEDLHVRPGSAGVPMPGYRVRVVDEAGTSVPAGVEGSVVIDQPLPPGTLIGLWGSDERFVDSYFRAVPGSYATGDGGVLTEDGELTILGRNDDVINVAGHRLSTGTIEEAIAGHEAVAECAVVGARDGLKGQMPLAFVVTLDGAQVDDAVLRTEVVQLVRDEVGAIAAPKAVVRVARLPKTRSGKVVRKTIRSIADGQPYDVPATIEDPAALEEIADALRRREGDA